MSRQFCPICSFVNFTRSGFVTQYTSSKIKGQKPEIKEIKILPGAVQFAFPLTVVPGTGLPFSSEHQQ